MLDKDTLINVTNRNNGVTYYKVPDLGIERFYEPNEVKTVTMEELTKLSYSIGGKRLLERYLILDNKEAVAELLGEVDPEYFYTEEDIRKILLEGSVDQLLDCLDFGGKGVTDNIKKIAVELRLNDMRKREAILEKTGFNVTNAISINDASVEPAEEKKETPKRRTAPIKKDTDYEIVSI